MDSLVSKVPPQSLDAEQSVLGAMLIERDAIARVAELLTPEHFYKETHQIIFDAICALYQRSEPVDLVTLSEELRRREKLEIIGGGEALTALIDIVPTAANVEHYARIVEEKAIRRQLMRAGHGIVGLGLEGEEKIEDLLDKAEQQIFHIGQRRFTQQFVPIKEILKSTLEHIDELYSRDSEVTGIATGFKEFDTMTAGLQPAELIVIAARPGMGKTSFCLNIAQHAAIDCSVPVAFFSLEMAKEQLVQRMLCAEALVDAHRLRTGKLHDGDWKKIADSMNLLSKAEIYIDDSSSISVLEMRSKVRRLKAERGLGVIVVDYLQLIRGHGRIENRVQEISDIARGLKAMAKDLRVPVLAVSQLSREVEKRTDKRPLLSDLRESGAIEQEADLVAFIYRDSYYNEKSEKQNTAEIIIAKQRNGPVGTVELVFVKEYTKFGSKSKHSDSYANAKAG